MGAGLSLGRIHLTLTLLSKKRAYPATPQALKVAYRLAKHSQELRYHFPLVASLAVDGVSFLDPNTQ
jgi:hypothetical protein